MRPADADQRLKRAEWVVRAISPGLAERLIARHHYAGGSAKQSCYLHGLFRREVFWDEFCHGAAHWLPPSRSVAKSLLPDNPNGVLGLSRLVCAEDAPGNSASFLMARSMRLIDRARWPVLVTYADTWRGHTGAIYKATGWSEAGVTEPKAVYTLAGRVISTLNGNKTWTHGEMMGRGAQLEGRFPKIRFVHRRAA